MFVFERFFKARQRKITKWENDKAEWLAENNMRSEYGFESRYPYPVRKFKNVSQYVIPTLIFAVAFCLIFFAITEGVEEHKKEMNATTPGKTCRMFNKNDHVKIKSGDYANATGEIVGGCNNGDKYEVKLDKGFTADLPADGQNAIDVSGKVVSINTYKDLTLIEEKKDAK